MLESCKEYYVRASVGLYLSLFFFFNIKVKSRNVYRHIRILLAGVLEVH